MRLSLCATKCLPPPPGFSSPPYLSPPLSCTSLSPHPPYIPLHFSILGLPPLIVLSTPFFFPLGLPFFGVGSSHPGLWGSPYPPSPLRYYSSADYPLLQVASGFRIPSSVCGLFRMLLGSFHGCAFVFYFLLRFSFLPSL